MKKQVICIVSVILVAGSITAYRAYTTYSNSLTEKSVSETTCTEETSEYNGIISETAATEYNDEKNVNESTDVSTETGEPLSGDELSKIISEYKDLGVTYDEKSGEWYFNGKKVRYFLDVLNSNGEAPNSGKFHGAIREWENENGTVDIHTVRDFSKPDKDGNGTLTGIEENK